MGRERHRGRAVREEPLDQQRLDGRFGLADAHGVQSLGERGLADADGFAQPRDLPGVLPESQRGELGLPVHHARARRRRADGALDEHAHDLPLDAQRGDGLQVREKSASNARA